MGDSERGNILITFSLSHSGITSVFGEVTEGAVSVFSEATDVSHSCTALAGMRSSCKRIPEIDYCCTLYLFDARSPPIECDERTADLTSVAMQGAAGVFETITSVGEGVYT